MDTLIIEKKDDVSFGYVVQKLFREEVAIIHELEKEVDAIHKALKTYQHFFVSVLADSDFENMGKQVKKRGWFFIKSAGLIGNILRREKKDIEKVSKEMLELRKDITLPYNPS